MIQASYKSAHSRSRSKNSHVQRALIAANWRRLSFTDRNIHLRSKMSRLTSPRQASEVVCPHVLVSASVVSGPESLGCVLGKTLGSGTYAKVRAAWSQKQHKLVGHFHISRSPSPLYE